MILERERKFTEPGSSAWNRTFRRGQRYAHILWVLSKHGLAHFLERPKLNDLHCGEPPSFPGNGTEVISLGARLRIILEELGPTFIKIGQLLSTRPDLLPFEMQLELEKLQDRVSPAPFPAIKAIIEQELGADLDAVFTQFEAVPIAAASIGQVHKARLKDGMVVAVKVQRPDITWAINTDLDILLHLIPLLERRLAGWKIQRPALIVEEFAKAVAAELDYTIEAANLERFASCFGADPTVHIPRVCRALTSKKVLTMEFIDGIKASHLDRLKAEGYDLKRIARHGADLTMKQIFVHGFFHADPHPGNLAVLPHHVICFFDLGQVGRIDRVERENFAEFLTSLLRQNPIKAASALSKMTETAIDVDRRLLEEDMQRIMRRHLSVAGRHLGVSRLLHDLVGIATVRGLRLPPACFLMLKALSTIEALGTTLDPDFNFVRCAMPHLSRIEAARLQSGRVGNGHPETSVSWLQLLGDLPSELHTLVTDLKEGKIQGACQGDHCGELIASCSGMARTVAGAILVGAATISAVLLITSGVLGRWSEVSAVSGVGWLLGCLLGMGVVMTLFQK
ncbi:MAG: hypothetical protein A2V62_06905 [Nitrospirae bacterium RBG_19FT_COMBO_58_9]|nr:MAG: hypothetical protein A2V62_06905 [Nitrospirae bacterium RBG_19FT_COMBO_58_9]